MIGLRALARSASCIICVTVPVWLAATVAPHALRISQALHLSGHVADSVLEMISFTGNGGLNDSNDAGLGDYDGVLRVRRLPTLHALTPPPAASAEPTFLFKVKRKRLVIEKFSLPPDSTHSDAVASGCNTHGHHNGTSISSLPAVLDF